MANGTAVTKRSFSTPESRQRRRVLALEMKISGATYEMIARKLGVSTTTAAKDVRKSLRELAKREVRLTSEYRALALSRYERMVRRAMPHTFKDPESKDFEPTIEQQLAAQDRVIRAQTRIDRILGIEATEKVDVKPVPSSIKVEVITTGVVEVEEHEAAVQEMLTPGAQPA